MATADPIQTLLNEALARAASIRRWPVSTYRLQFHAKFTFADATRVLPYLAELGVTHVYASPYLAAAAGSTHGYDVIDHNRLNPELGTEADYDAFLAGLKANGLTHILDTVPNHVGVATNDNVWWNDVLENGTDSKYAGFFDIVWDSNARPELKNKVLLPTLGKPYGQAVDDGELKLSFDAAAGRFYVNYFERRFPLAPESYARILSKGGDAGGKLTSLIMASETLDASSTAEARLRNSGAIKTGLAELVKNDPSVLAHIEAAIKAFNGTPGEPASFDALDRLLDAQNFRLSDWHVAFDEINYRRFFDVNDLAALSMEKREVFEAAHALILPKLARGEIAGLRIDHPDGLFDPAAYFIRLQQHFLLAIAENIYAEKGDAKDWPNVRAQLLARLESFNGTGTGPERWPLFVSAEKILAMDEPLIEDWAIQGTSGYDYLVLLNALFVDPAAEPKFDALWEALTHDTTPYDELAYRNKRRMLETSLASELHTLTYRLDRIARKHRRSIDFTFRALQIAIRETVSCFGVYRTYVQGEAVTETDRKHVNAAIEKAKSRNPLTPAGVFDFLRDNILQTYAPTADAAEKRDVQAFAGKFQQLTSPVTAKGIEDTTFYQYNRMLSLNEVGGEPAEFGIKPERLHRFLADRQKHWPYALSGTSTHDTKRSEDVRARLNVLADLPDEWAAAVRGWFAANASLRVDNPDGVSPSPGEEFLIYQTLVGAWPLDAAEEKSFQERTQAYVLKAIREAKLRTRWGEPNDKHEAAVKAFVDALFDSSKSAKFHDTFRPLLKKVTHFGLLNSLTQTAIKLVSPGVPDTYQGTELWDFSLVDPDNRRPVDYALREKLLAGIDDATPAELIADLKSARAKLKLTATALRLRRDHVDLFTKGDYTPLAASGGGAANVFGFVRKFGGKSAAVVVPLHTAAFVAADGLPVGDVWGDTAVTLPAGKWKNALTGESVASGKLSDVLRQFPVALLVNA